MFLPVKQIDRTGLRVDRVVPPPSVSLDDGRNLPFEPVSLSGQVTPRRGGYRFQGQVSTEGTFECSRCLETFRQPLTTDFDLFYAETAPEPPPGEDEETREEALSFAPLKNGAIDLGALVSEQIYLNLPLKPLCTPDCLGLCATCGANRNVGACECAVGAEDSPPCDPLAVPTRSGGR